MTGDRSLLISMVQVNNQVVRLENGRVLPVRAIGSVSTEDVVLSNVWYVPGLHMNSVSVDQLTADHDLFVKMEGAVCLVTKNSDGSEVGRAHLRADYKYEVDSLIVQQN
ncbi:hypothetical protein HU200_062843 [Digitaria exilis]|uniref:Retrovirus-related Pol polyprotein from transposon TNT 1-94-like beta-barrel domain-containing protein n=1 Tax=Digitaria exilis TaxID=1010633 RepID=A0A835A8A5_9POAL|nr:hypothetical protein HU200_062843 [Digitaria exilis]